MTENRLEVSIPADRLDLASPEALLELPLLRTITEEEWIKLSYPVTVREYAQNLTALDFERDAEGIVDHLLRLADDSVATTVFDLLVHAQKREWDQLSQRIRLACGEANIPKGEQIAVLMAAPENAETIITFDDETELDEILERGVLADWMLFLHLEQKRVSHKDFSGPARLRGISGSGKTSVLIHRARYLAKQYNQQILVVTLTESMRKLLEALIRDLCGVEQRLIEVHTVSQVAKMVIEDLDTEWLRKHLVANSDQIKMVLENTVAFCKNLPEFSASPFKSWNREDFATFLKEEISYVRSRLLPPFYSKYLDPRSFRRQGRGAALFENGRKLCYEAVRIWDGEFEKIGIQNSEGIVSKAALLLARESPTFTRFRCAVADEVQDLSQIDITLLGGLKTPAGQRLSVAENGLFLVGDGAQSVYPRGFSLREAGIEIANRSFLLKKNYRNTFEILKAAYLLIQKYEFADSDEDDVSRPTSPDFAKRRGERPKIVKCNGLQEEALLITDQVKELLSSNLAAGQICIIAPSKHGREVVKQVLESKQIMCVELREDIEFEGDRVKISTIESAKGHEFAVVFIVSLLEGALPRTGALDEELAREASRLYVGMTRAREALWLLYSPGNGFQPSRFLLDIQSECDELAYDKGILRSISKW